MDVFTNYFEIARDFLPMLFGIALVFLLLSLANWFFLGKRLRLGAEAKLPRQLLMMLLSISAVLAIILLLPMSDSTRGQVLSLLGVVFTGVIALSSTTFVANAMSGLLLRLVNSYKPGDFIRINGSFGRVTERGLFHTEIQTEDRDLTTFPNLYLISNPVTVVHSSGTIITVELSLGYDVATSKIEPLLQEAAIDTGLTDPFVLVTNLGDFSVGYKVAGFLTDVGQLVTVRSLLRKNVMSILHRNGVEIVSPGFMNQRALDPKQKVMPKGRSKSESREELDATPESLMFEKAEGVSELERLRQHRQELTDQLNALEEIKSKLTDAEAIEKLDNQLSTIKLETNRTQQAIDLIKSKSKEAS
ncbi:mechanosensitive ion channel domain-containing protein [Litoribrevibacter euphylliae]|uniref:Small-conductance mechanosensitive channel n=1 Tax=Litoribrevibacter euphylliae TaxID=1834034 RepID=A0ABV7HKZ2_9GAMM